MEKTEKDMFDELFIVKEVSGAKEVPLGSKEDYWKAVHSERGNQEKSEALFSWIEMCRHESLRRNGEFSGADLGEAIRTIQGLERELGEVAGLVLIRAGGQSELLRDYESAAEFYQASLMCRIAHLDGRYWRLNNLGFCLNFSRCFERAEEYLKEAIFMKPLRYNAWKNLGVSLEHQGEVDRAAECYVQAMTCSNSEERSSAHFRRLLERYPELSNIYVKIRSGENE